MIQKRPWSHYTPRPLPGMIWTEILGEALIYFKPHCGEYKHWFMILLWYIKLNRFINVVQGRMCFNAKKKVCLSSQFKVLFAQIKKPHMCLLVSKILACLITLIILFIFSCAFYCAKLSYLKSYQHKKFLIQKLCSTVFKIIGKKIIIHWKGRNMEWISPSRF